MRAVAAADAADAVRAGAVDVALLRLPADTSGLAVIPLYEETTVVVVPADHLLTAADEVTAADLDGEPMLVPLDDVVDWAARPRHPGRAPTRDHRGRNRTRRRGARRCSSFRSRWRGCTTARTSRTARSPTRPPAPWRSPSRRGRSRELVEEFIGIVRGRKPGSSRGQVQQAPKRTAREKTLAKQAARAAAGKICPQAGPAKRGRR